MSKNQRGTKFAAVLLGLLMASALAGIGTPGSLQAQNAGCSTCSGGAPAEVVYTQPTPVYSAPVHVASATPCGCSTGGCKTGGCKSRGCRSGCTSCLKKSSPQCDCQFCELDVKKGEVEKTGFKVEQKEVCVPAVRLPWKKNCPPTRSKVRTVNVLKKEKYKSPKCEYKWSVHEPEDFEESEAGEKKEAAQKKPAAPNEAALTPEEIKDFDLAPGEKIISVFSDPSEALGDVPRPPVE